jgi:hypothetical protein
MSDQESKAEVVAEQKHDPKTEIMANLRASKKRKADEDRQISQKILNEVSDLKCQLEQQKQDKEARRTTKRAKRETITREKEEEEEQPEEKNSGETLSKVLLKTVVVALFGVASWVVQNRLMTQQQPKAVTNTHTGARREPLPQKKAVPSFGAQPAYVGNSGFVSS